jgi:hypothetical protein
MPGLSSEQLDNLADKLADELLISGEDVVSRGPRACCEYAGEDGRCIVHPNDGTT